MINWELCYRNRRGAGENKGILLVYANFHWGMLASRLDKLLIVQEVFDKDGNPTSESSRFFVKRMCIEEISKVWGYVNLDSKTATRPPIHLSGACSMFMAIEDIKSKWSFLYGRVWSEDGKKYSFDVYNEKEHPDRLLLLQEVKDKDGNPTSESGRLITTRKALESIIEAIND